MPQRLSKYCPGATVQLSALSLDDKPDLATLVCDIIAQSANIDVELSLLLVRVLGAEATPAIAMFDAIRGDYMRGLALQTAAKAALTPPQCKVLNAILKIARSAQSDRHKLAHGIWGTCPERPGALLVCDPQFLRWQAIEQAKNKPTTLAEFLKNQGKLNERVANLYEYDRRKILVYTKADLLRIGVALADAKQALYYFRFYLKPMVRVRMTGSLEHLNPILDDLLKGLNTSGGALRRLKSIRRFREALADQGAKKKRNRNRKARRPRRG